MCATTSNYAFLPMGIAMGHDAVTNHIRCIKSNDSDSFSIISHNCDKYKE